MIRALTYYFFFFFTALSFSQDFDVVGKVVDSSEKEVAYANVVLTGIETTEFYSGTTTNDNGEFVLEKVKKGEYKIVISFLGFQNYSKTLTVNSDVNLSEIILEQNYEELDGVTIVSKRPTIERKVDRVVFNVENSTLSNENVLDVLKHTPGVVVQDDNITVKQSAPTIYINDRRVHLTINEIQQLLEGTSATNIKSIEVITNPPARYDADGGAVLNIITSKNITIGYNGSVYGNYKQGYVYPKFSMGTSHFYKTKKLDAYFNYSISPRKDFRNIIDNVNFIENSEVVGSWNTDYNRTRESSNQSINSNIDYEINDNNSLGFTTNIFITPGKGVRNNINSVTEVYNEVKVLDSKFNTINNSVDETYNLAFTLNYSHDFKNAGEKLLANVHYTDYDFSNFQDVNTGYFLPNTESPFRENRFHTIADQKVKLYTGQIDYELPLNGSGFFEAGVKVSYVNSENDIDQFIVVNNSPMEDLNNSDTFLYDETNYAAYASYSKDWEDWSLKFGLRSEFTDLSGVSLEEGDLNIDDYAKLFPSFYAQYRINENNEIYFNYNKRINRPNFNELNPFKFFLNDNSYKAGNPNLLPEIDDIFTLGYNLNGTYTFEVYYRYEDSPNIEFTFQDNTDRLIKRIFTNINHSVSYGLDFTTYTPILNNWNLYVLSSLFYYENNFFSPDEVNALLKNEQWSFYAQIVNYFSLLKDKSLTANVSFTYLSPIYDGPAEISSRSGLDINMRKALWGGRGSLSVGVDDIFNNQNFSQNTVYLNQDISLNSKLENRLFKLSFLYKFGNFRLNSNKKEIELDERERLERTED